MSEQPTLGSHGYEFHNDTPTGDHVLVTLSLRKQLAKLTPGDHEFRLTASPDHPALYGVPVHVETCPCTKIRTPTFVDRTPRNRSERRAQRKQDRRRKAEARRASYPTVGGES